MTHIKVWHEDLADTKFIKAASITVSGKKNNEDKPSANVLGPIEVQTNSVENLKLSIQGVHFIPADLTSDSSTALTWEDILTIYRARYDGTNPVYLNVVYGSGISEATLSAVTSEGSSITDIPCVLDDFNFPISVVDSREGYLPVGTLKFTETK